MFNLQGLGDSSMNIVLIVLTVISLGLTVLLKVPVKCDVVNQEVIQDGSKVQDVSK